MRNTVIDKKSDIQTNTKTEIKIQNQIDKKYLRYDIEFKKYSNKMYGLFCNFNKNKGKFFNECETFYNYIWDFYCYNSEKFDNQIDKSQKYYIFLKKCMNEIKTHNLFTLINKNKDTVLDSLNGEFKSLKKSLKIQFLTVIPKFDMNDNYIKETVMGGGVYDNVEFFSFRHSMKWDNVNILTKQYTKLIDLLEKTEHKISDLEIERSQIGWDFDDDYYDN